LEGNNDIKVLRMLVILFFFSRPLQLKRWSLIDFLLVHVVR